MAYAYLTEAHMPRDYWFHAIQHTCRMTNQISAKVHGKLTMPFELVHRTPPNTRTWFPLFSIIYFYKDSDKDKDCTSFHSKTIIGITIRQSTKTNALSIYNPITKQYYDPDTYKFDPSRLPCTDFPAQSHYDGDLHTDL
jgi:hypothetical protein